MKKIVFVVNVDWFFLSHRLPLALEAFKKNYQVYVITKDTGHKPHLENYGFIFVNIDFERSGRNIFKELTIILKLKTLYQNIQPDIIHHITLKPSIYGTVAARKAKVQAKIINAVSGLGYEFTDNRQSFNKKILLKLLRWAFAAQDSFFIFQNKDDMAFYQSLNFLNQTNYKIIKGSGVDENVFGFTPPVKKEKLAVVLAARMLKDKGILEFIKAAEILRDDFDQSAEFFLVGGIDEFNPAHIKQKELEEKCDQKYIRWLGYEKDIKKIYENSDVVSLPSYREGLPKSLVEAMAVGRPIVTTNAIGCRDCVDEGYNGFKVPIKDAITLASKIKLLLLNEQLRLTMGRHSRKKMVDEMSLQLVINQTFELYEA